MVLSMFVSEQRCRPPHRSGLVVTTDIRLVLIMKWLRGDSERLRREREVTNRYLHFEFKLNHISLIQIQKMGGSRIQLSNSTFAALDLALEAVLKAHVKQTKHNRKAAPKQGTNSADFARGV
jgi:hypothetical protein